MAPSTRSGRAKRSGSRSKGAKSEMKVKAKGGDLIISIVDP